MIAVAAGILKKEGKILLAQRKPGSHFALKWEFPGGKLEPGESPEEALARELKEELGLETRTGEIFDAVRVSAPGKDLLILFYFSEILEEGEPRALDCRQFRWALPESLPEYDLAPADRRAAEKLLGQRRAMRPDGE